MNSELSTIHKRFYDGEVQVANKLPGTIRDSWLRCMDKTIPMSGNIEYRHVKPDTLDQLKYQHESLLRVSNRHIEQLYRAVAGAGWSVLLTDQQCHALQVRRSERLTNSGIKSAFIDGVVLNEEAVGTTAMSCALNSKKFSRVFGAEHFKNQHHSFNCAAVPVFDHSGQVCGSLDITNEHPINDMAVFYMLETCAKNIQKSLILNLKDTFVIEVIPSSGQFGDITNLLLAITPDGKVSGCNEAASNFITGQNRYCETYFDAVFSTDFTIITSNRAAAGEPFYLQLHSGVTLATRVINTPQFVPQSDTGIHLPPINNQSSTDITSDFGDDQLNQTIKRAVRVINRLPVMLHGESGVGKEVTARYLHDASKCSGKFISINCASIPENLIESELFGYQAGAFTGADKKGFKGRIAESDKGTLFLDEIGDMPLTLQSRLLRVLETREVSPLGSAREQKVDFQLICATNVNLEQAIEDGRFRQDLYFRLKGISVFIKPLRDRMDKLAIANAILARDCEIKQALSDEVAQFINGYTWPGNIRELRNVLLYADAIGEGSSIVHLDEIPEEYHQCQSDLSDPLWQDNAESEQSGRLLAQANKRLITQVVDDCNGNMSKAAKRLGISRATLYRKLAKERDSSVLN